MDKEEKKYLPIDFVENTYDDACFVRIIKALEELIDDFDDVAMYCSNDCINSLEKVRVRLVTAHSLVKDEYRKYKQEHKEIQSVILNSILERGDEDD